MATGKSAAASAGTGMGTGASRNAPPGASLSRPTSITNNLAGWSAFFSSKHSTCAGSPRPGTFIVWKQPAWPDSVWETPFSLENSCMSPLMAPPPPCEMPIRRHHFSSGETW